MKEFEVGKWYKGNESSKYIKFERLEKHDGYNRIFFTERIDDGVHKFICNYWANNHLEKYALNNPVNLSEISKYLPKGHPDLSTEPNYEIY